MVEAIINNAMGTLSALLDIYACEKLLVIFSHKGPVIQSFDVFFVATLIQL